MDPKVTVGRTRSGWVTHACVSCERHIHVLEGPSGVGVFFRCGHCTGLPRAHRVTEFTLAVPDRPRSPGAMN